MIGVERLGLCRGVSCQSRGRGVVDAQGRCGGSLPTLTLWLALRQGWKLENLPEDKRAFARRLRYT